MSRPEKISGQSRLSRGTGFFGIRDCPAGLYGIVVALLTHSHPHPQEAFFQRRYYKLLTTVMKFFSQAVLIKSFRLIFFSFNAINEESETQSYKNVIVFFLQSSLANKNDFFSQ
jgi:hypothetical protein